MKEEKKRLKEVYQMLMMSPQTLPSTRELGHLFFIYNIPTVQNFHNQYAYFYHKLKN